MSNIRLNAFSSRGTLFRIDCRRDEQISDDTTDFTNCDLALRTVYWMATMGVRASIDPVFEKSEPVLLGKLLADAMGGRTRHVVTC